MKKVFLFALLFVTTISIAQEKTITKNTHKKHELKLNAFSLIAFKAFDVSYEYLIDEESSFGTSLFLRASEDMNATDFYKTFSITPYYRRYFSKGYAKGFFIEGFATVLNLKEYDFSVSNYKSETNFALGISAGGKFVTKKGFIAEIFLGLGRKLGSETPNGINIPIVGRGGITLGYRF